MGNDNPSADTLSLCSECIYPQLFCNGAEYVRAGSRLRAAATGQHISPAGLLRVQSAINRLTVSGLVTMESRLADYDDISSVYKNDDRLPPPSSVRADANMNRRQSANVIKVQEMVSDSFKPIALIDKYVDSLFPETELIDKRDVIANGVGFPILISYHAVFLCLFLVFFIIGYIKDTTTVYLAPYQAHATDNCKTISISTTQNFKVDSNGIWEGSSGYDASKAVYELELIRANLNNEMYYSMMEAFEIEMKRVSELSQSRDLQFQAISLASFNARWTPSKEERTQGGEGVINMYFIGKADYIFNSDIEDYSFFDKDSSTICTPGDTSLVFDPSKGAYVMTIDTSVNGSYVLGSQHIVEPCPDIFKLYESFVLTQTGMRATEQIAFNAASMTTALAITYGIAPMSSLTRVFDITSNPDTWALSYRRRLTDDKRRSLTSSKNVKSLMSRGADTASANAEVASSYDDGDDDYYYYYYYYGDDDRDDDYSYLPGYTGGFYVDHYYDTMESIFCLSPKDSKPSTYNDTCFLQVGSMLVLPMILNRGFYNETGTDIFQSTSGKELVYSRCHNSECPEMYIMAEKYARDPYSDDYASRRYLKSSILLLSVPILDAVSDESILDSLVSIASNSYNSVLDEAMSIANSAYNQVIYKDAYPDNFETNLNYGSSSSSIVSLKEYMDESIDSFFATFGESSLLDKVTPVFLLINEIEKLSNYANLVEGTVLNEEGQLFFHNYTGYKDQLFNQDVFDSIRGSPPVSLVQGYMECSTDPGTAATNNLGVAFANTSTFSAIFFSLLISASVYWINKRNSGANKPYIIPKAKKQALNVLALTALLEELVHSTPCNKEVCSEILLALNSTNNYSDDTVTNGKSGDGEVSDNTGKLFVQMRDLNMSSKKVSTKL